ncbi:terminase [Enterobacter hormaechei]|uniref:terminase n=1 Tax=Enterobacter hormaechei TaxID=158836 RepID=UPI0018EC95A5|nr:terminase [Enterobacter hormaechei]MBJ6559480.1 terminase [Enterobacter hormaechei]
MKPEHIKLLSDKDWRLNNLYWITDKEGKPTRFRMTPEQREYFEGIHTRNIILKARQLGFTTEVCIIQLDAALFESAKCALIAHTLNDAKRLFREKVKYAYDKLPAEIKAANPASNDSSGELVFKKGGSLYVSTSFRGGTLRYLHVSEFGKICAKYPDKAREIVTGAFEAVSTGCFATIESTAEGRAGYFFDYCQTAEKALLQGKPLSPLDWKFFFFSWWKNPQYAIDPVEPLPQRLIEYFAEMAAKHGVVVNERQKAWYYAKQFRWLYTNKRIGQIPDNSHLPVHTFWDIGVGDSTAIWFVREVGEEFHIIDYYENSGEGLRHYMKVLKDRGYEYGEHWGPHDIENREFGADAKSRKELAQEGYEIDGQVYSMTFNVVPKTGVDTGIESVREILPSCVFDEEKCAEGISHLEGYRKEWDDKRGCWKDKPLHDFTSHGADGFRYFAVAKNNQKQVGAIFFT